MGGGEGGVAAEVHLHGRREPPQAEGIAFGQIESSFREVVLRRHRLHSPSGQPRLQRHNGGGVAPEMPGGESIHLILVELHGAVIGGVLGGLYRDKPVAHNFLKPSFP